jgi:excisionase family DNA binding protein
MQHHTSSRSQERSGPPLGIEPISLRIPDACRFIGISRSTLYLLIASGEVEIIKLGSSTLVLTSSLQRLIEQRRATGHQSTPARELGK